MKRLLTGTVLGAALLLAMPASADPPATPGTGVEDTEKDNKIKVEVVRKANGGILYKVKTPLVLHGRIQKPSAFYLLERTRLNTGVTPLNRAFTDRILKSVNKSPF